MASSPTRLSSRASSPTSPNRRARRGTASNGAGPGLRAPPRKHTPVAQMSVRELHDAHDRNARILAAPTPSTSTSTYVRRLSAEQAAIEARLVDLVGVEGIRDRLARTSIAIPEDTDMSLDGAAHPHPPQPPAAPAPISAKQRALARYAPQPSQSANANGGANVATNGSTFTMEEAMEIEREAHALDLKRQQDQLDRKRRHGLPIQGEVLTRQEREERIWAFMNHKPTDSDLEDDDDEDSDADDPATWFDDDQDDGVKGQSIVEPDADLSNVIRIDEAHIPYNIFYEPRGEGD